MSSRRVISAATREALQFLRGRYLQHNFDPLDPDKDAEHKGFIAQQLSEYTRKSAGMTMTPRQTRYIQGLHQKVLSRVLTVQCHSTTPTLRGAHMNGESVTSIASPDLDLSLGLQDKQGNPLKIVKFWKTSGHITLLCEATEEVFKVWPSGYDVASGVQRAFNPRPKEPKPPRWAVGEALYIIRATGKPTRGEIAVSGVVSSLGPVRVPVLGRDKQPVMEDVNGERRVKTREKGDASSVNIKPDELYRDYVKDNHTCSATLMFRTEDELRAYYKSLGESIERCIAAKKAPAGPTDLFGHASEGAALN